MMRKVKMILWLILFGVIAIVVYSNKQYFFNTKQSIQILIPFKEPYTFKEMPNAVYFVAFFVIGFLVAYFLSLSERFKSKKTIKNLNAAATSQLQEISTLKKEIDTLKSGAADNKTPEPEAQEPEIAT